MADTSLKNIYYFEVVNVEINMLKVVKKGFVKLSIKRLLHSTAVTLNFCLKGKTVTFPFFKNTFWV